jgi:hypothetical protein
MIGHPHSGSNANSSTIARGWIVRTEELACETNEKCWLQLGETYEDCELKLYLVLPRRANSDFLLQYPGQGKLVGSNKCEIKLEYDD